MIIEQGHCYSLIYLLLPKPTIIKLQLIHHCSEFSQLVTGEFSLMWLFGHQPPQTIQQPHSPLHKRHHPSRLHSHTRHPTSVTLRPSTTTATTNTNHIIQSLCKKGNLKKAIQTLTQEPNPTQRTYELLIFTCAVENSLSDAVTVNRHLIEDGFDEDTFLGTKLIDMYSELGEIEYARQVFDEMPSRTIYVWNAFFQALTLSGHGLDVFGYFSCMNTDGIKPDRFTYTYVLKACVASNSPVSLLPKGKEIHAHILRHGFETNVHIMTTLVDMYAKFGCVFEAGYVFYNLSSKNVVSWSAMIACYAKNGRAFEALQLFGEMVCQVNDMTPNSVTMVSVLQACGALAALEQGKLLHGYILRRNLDSVLPVIVSLITLYARCGELETGKRVFDQMVRKDVVSWNAMISSYGMHGFGKKAIEIYEEMISNKIAPTPITFVSVLGACSHAGLVDEGKILFESITKDHKMRPTIEHYACMVDLLGRANRLDEAAKIIQELRIEPGPKVWGSLLGSCRIHSNVELAERASKRLFELEPTNAGNYVLLSEIYAEACLWEEVTRVKKLLQNQGLEKKSGCSWIEVKRKIYSFASVDEFNPHVEQLHAFLLKLSTEMKGNGYRPVTKVVMYDVDEVEKERILLGHSEKLAVAFGLINSSRGETIRITKNLRLCEDCHSVTKFVSKFANREIMVRDVNRIHRFKDGFCSCGDYW